MQFTASTRISLLPYALRPTASGGQEYVVLLGYETQSSGGVRGQWADFGVTGADPATGNALSEAATAGAEQTNYLIGLPEDLSNALSQVGSEVQATNGDIIWLLPIKYNEDLPAYFSRSRSFVQSLATGQQEQYETTMLAWMPTSTLFNAARCAPSTVQGLSARSSLTSDFMDFVLPAIINKLPNLFPNSGAAPNCNVPFTGGVNMNNY